MNGFTSESQVEGVCKDEEPLVIGVRCVRLYLLIASLLNELPIIAILEACLHENAIQVGREVLPANDLPDEVHISLEVGSCAHLVANLLDLINLLSLQVF